MKKFVFKARGKNVEACGCNHVLTKCVCSNFIKASDCVPDNASSWLGNSGQKATVLPHADFIGPCPATSHEGGAMLSCRLAQFFKSQSHHRVLLA